MEDERETQIESLVKLIYRMGGLRRELMSYALPELGGQGFTALAAIYRRAPARVSDIAQALNVDLSVASRQVRVLLEAGYVTREADPDDGRASLLSLTASGLEALRDSHRRMVAASVDALADWRAQEIESLAEGLQRLHGAFFPEAETAPAATSAPAR